MKLPKLFNGGSRSPVLASDSRPRAASGSRRRRKRDELLDEIFPDTTYDRGRSKQTIMKNPLKFNVLLRFPVCSRFSSLRCR